MGEPVSENLPVLSSEDRLDSWKEIAAYLDRDVTTVQRWEKREGMPVHRHQHDRIGSVYASRTELDAWVRSRSAHPGKEDGSENAALEEAIRPATRKLQRGWIYALGLFAALLLALSVWLRRTEYFWRSPLAGARFQQLTDFDGTEHGAAISRDGRLVAFLSDRDGPMDVWLTQVGSGEFHNLTRGDAAEVVNASLRNLAFSPDGSLVTFWARRPPGEEGNISIWAVPTLGGQPRKYLEGAAECDWSHHGPRIAYHTTGPGDPLFISEAGRDRPAAPVFTATVGRHSHFPLWAPDDRYVYFVQGTLPDKLDIWRIPPSGGPVTRITSQNTRVSHPVMVGPRTLMYLATESDGSGPWLYSMDSERRIPHQVSAGLDRYTSLAASADGKRLVLTHATPRRTLWHAEIADGPNRFSQPSHIALATSNGLSPRLGSDFLIYVSSTSKTESIRQRSGGTDRELWSNSSGRLIGGPAISPDERFIAFSLRQNGRSLLYLMQADGSKGRTLTGSLDLQGGPVWDPEGRFLTVAANQSGVPHLFHVPLDGGAPAILFRAIPSVQRGRPTENSSSIPDLM